MRYLYFLRWLLRHPYARLMRLDKPVGIWLVLWPAWWGATMGSQAFHPGILILLFFGAVFMRSAGCVINDLTDREIDASVARTKSRPLASGEVSERQALILIAILLSGALLTAMALGLYPVLLGILFLPLVILYPRMKRITWWPQAFLGLTFNAGVPIGWTAATGAFSWEIVLLYLAAFFWTLGYDTLYAHQDKEDDALIGVRSTALYFGNGSKSWIAAFYAAFMLLVLGAGAGLELNSWFYFLLSIPALLLAVQLLTVDLDRPQSCLFAFQMNQWVGLFVFLAIIAGI